MRERARAAPAVRLSLPNLLFVLSAIVAMAIQIMVVQAHIHIPQATGRSTSVSIVTVAKTFLSGSQSATDDRQAGIPRDKYPINEDPSNCPLCQEIAHSGQFVQSAAVLAHVPAWISVHFIVFSEALPSLFTVSHSWQSRAPPQV